MLLTAAFLMTETAKTSATEKRILIGWAIAGTPIKPIIAVKTRMMIGIATTPYQMKLWTPVSGKIIKII